MFSLKWHKKFQKKYGNVSFKVDSPETLSFPYLELSVVANQNKHPMYKCSIPLPCLFKHIAILPPKSQNGFWVKSELEHIEGRKMVWANFSGAAGCWVSYALVGPHLAYWAGNIYSAPAPPPTPHSALEHFTSSPGCCTEVYGGVARRRQGGAGTGEILLS